MKKLLAVLAVLAASITVWAQGDARPEILVLGMYHMANPGRDIYNMQADDVQSPKRQQEIVQVIEVLKKFHPTKVAIESDVGSGARTQQYSDYLAGKYSLANNEIDQIGYRVAKELGHKAVYPVDESGDFPIGRVSNYAKANGQGEKFDAMMTSMGTLVKEQNEFLRSHTVLEMLEYMNSDAMAAKGVALYYEFASYGDPGDYAGPDLLAAWYQRNIRIYHNIVKLIESRNERILVIYGAGHLGWLQQDVANDATVRLRKLEEFGGQR